MSKKIFALEEIEPLNDATTTADLAEADTAASEIHANDDVLTEATDIFGKTEELREVAAKSIEAGGLTEDAARSIEVATEHFSKRLKYRKPISPAMEGFSDATSRITATKELCKNLYRLRKCLAPRIGIAQEGFFDRIKNALSRNFTSMEEIHENIQRYSDAYDRDVTDPKSFRDPAWGRIFAIRGKYKITPHDINKELQDLQHIVNGELVSLIKRGTIILRESRNQVVEGDNHHYSEQVKAIIQLGADANKLYEEFVATYNTGGKESSVDVEALDRASKRELVSLVKDLSANRTFAAEYDEFSKSIYANKRIIEAWSTYYRQDEEIEDVYTKEDTGGTFETEAYISHLSDTIRALAIAAEAVIRVDNKLIFGAYRYLKETVGK